MYIGRAKGGAFDDRQETSASSSEECAGKRRDASLANWRKLVSAIDQERPVNARTKTLRSSPQLPALTEGDFEALTRLFDEKASWHTRDTAPSPVVVAAAKWSSPISPLRQRNQRQL